MEGHKRTPRDSKWLLPALKTEGRGQRNKRKIEHADTEDEPLQSNSKQQKWMRKSIGDKAKLNSKTTKCRKQTQNSNNEFKTVKQKRIRKQDTSKSLGKEKKSPNVNNRNDCEGDAADIKKNEENSKDEIESNGTDAISDNVQPEQNAISDDEEQTSISESTSVYTRQVKKQKKDAVKKKSKILANKKYSCNFCGKSFIRESSLAEHIKWQHHSDIIKSTNGKNCELNLPEKVNTSTKKESVSVGTTIIAPLSPSGANSDKDESDIVLATDGSTIKDKHDDKVITSSGQDKFNIVHKSTVDGNSDETIHEGCIPSDQDKSEIIHRRTVKDNSGENISEVITFPEQDKSNVAHRKTLKVNSAKNFIEDITSSVSDKSIIVNRSTVNDKSDANINENITTSVQDTSENFHQRTLKDFSDENISEVKTSSRQDKSDIAHRNPAEGNCGENKCSEHDKSDIVEGKAASGMTVMDDSANDPYEKFLPETVCLIDAEKRQTSACPFCNKKFASEKGMKTHVDLHCQETPYRCGRCNKGLLSLGQKHIHRDPRFVKKKNYYVKQADMQKAYTCQHCQKGFSFQVTLDNHLLVCKRDTLTEDKDRVECEICHKTFSRFYLRNHMLSHSDDKKYICEFCGKAYNTGSQLWTHVMSVHKGQRFTCENCGTLFTQKAALQNHQNVLFGKCKADKEHKTGFKCVLCSRTFTSFRWLTRHQETHVVPESGNAVALREFNCKVCGKIFKTRHEQIRHERIHFNDKPHKCTECEMAFVQKGNLQSHMRIHTGERPFACHLCTKSFTQQSNLKAHIWKHSVGKVSSEGADKADSKFSTINTSNKESSSVLSCKVSRVDATSQTSTAVQQVILKDNNKFPSSKPVIVKIMSNVQPSTNESVTGTNTVTIGDNKDDLTAVIDSEAELVELSEVDGEIVDLNGKVIYVDESGQGVSEELLSNMQIERLADAQNNIIVRVNGVGQSASEKVSTHVLEHGYSSESPKVVGVVKDDMSVNTQVEDRRQYTTEADGGGNVVYVTSGSAKPPDKSNVETGKTVVYISDRSSMLGNNNGNYITNASSIEVRNKGSIVYMTDPHSAVGHSNNTVTLPYSADNIGDKDNTGGVSNPPIDVGDSTNTVSAFASDENRENVTLDTDQFAGIGQENNIVYVPYAFTGLGQKNNTIYVPRAFTNVGNKLTSVPDAFNSAGNKADTVQVSNELTTSIKGNNGNTIDDTNVPVKVMNNHMTSVGLEPKENVIYLPNMVTNDVMSIEKANENQGNVTTASMTNLTTEETVVPDVSNEQDTQLLSDSMDKRLVQSFKETIEIPKGDVIAKEAHVAEHVKESSQIVQEVLEALCK